MSGTLEGRAEIVVDIGRDTVRVCHRRNEYVDVPECYIRPKHPTIVTQHVVPMIGEHAGQVYKVTTIRGDQCEVKLASDKSRRAKRVDMPASNFVVISPPC